MLGISPDVWFPVITLIVGASLKVVFDVLAERRAFRRERLGREEQRRDSLRLRRLDFQHATLLEFQDVVSRLARFFGRAHHHDVMSFRASEQWGKSLLGEEVNQGITNEQGAFSRLRVRIKDEETRQLALAFSESGQRLFLRRMRRMHDVQ
ncbi:hypothetical protein [Sinorhizobium sp. RAC02]|uniref:hypothetical protein n=1 Tax=Sinorhizobium sp. RAC02 TaxID=1842534 RepID=UPI00083D3766|nr:hypothetical protein [Sinorhizobium sp. RAC02]